METRIHIHELVQSLDSGLLGELIFNQLQCVYQTVKHLVCKACMQGVAPSSNALLKKLSKSFRRTSLQ